MTTDPDQDSNPDVVLGEEAYTQVRELIANPPEPSPALRALLAGLDPDTKERLLVVALEEIKEFLLSWGGEIERDACCEAMRDDLQALIDFVAAVSP